MSNIRLLPSLLSIFKTKALQEENEALGRKNEDMLRELQSLRSRYSEVDVKWQRTEAQLLDAHAEVKVRR